MQKKTHVRYAIFKLKSQTWKGKTLLYSCNMHADTLPQIHKALSPEILINDDSIVPFPSLSTWKRHTFEMILLKRKTVWITISL